MLASCNYLKAGIFGDVILGDLAGTNFSLFSKTTHKYYEVLAIQYYEHIAVSRMGLGYTIL